jgi:hypothetical protein
MIIKKTEILIDLDNILPEELQLQSFSKKIIPKAVKKSAGKKKKGCLNRSVGFAFQIFVYGNIKQKACNQLIVKL